MENVYLTQLKGERKRWQPRLVLFSLLFMIILHNTKAQFIGITGTGAGINYTSYGTITANLSEIRPMSSTTTSVVVFQDFWITGFNTAVNLDQARLYYKANSASFGTANDASWNILNASITAVPSSDNDRATFTFDLTVLTSLVGTDIMFYICFTEAGTDYYGFPGTASPHTTAPSSQGQTYKIRFNSANAYNTQRIDGLVHEWNSTTQVSNRSTGSATRTLDMTWDADNIYFLINDGFTASSGDRIHFGFDRNPTNGGNANGTAAAFNGASFPENYRPDIIFRARGTGSGTWTNDRGVANGSNGWTYTGDIGNSTTADMHSVSGSNTSNLEVRISRSAIGTFTNLAIYVWFGNSSDNLYDSYPHGNPTTNALLPIHFAFNNLNNNVNVPSNRFFDAQYNQTSFTLFGITTYRNLRISNPSGIVNAIDDNDVIVNGDLRIDASGTFRLDNDTGNDLFLSGNFINNGTFNPNNRAVFFSGSNDQEITGSTNFDFFIVDKSSGSLKLNDNISINATSLRPLEINNSVGIDLNGKTLTMTGSGGAIRLGGTGTGRTITSGVAGGLFVITGNKSLESFTTAKTLTFGTNTTLRLNGGNLTLDGGGGNITLTINGTLDVSANTNTIGQTGSNTKTLSVASGATFQTNRSLNDVVDTGVTKSYSTGAHFVFSRNTAGSISTGTDLPATVASITINHTGTTPTIDLSANLSTGSMTLTNGVFNISGRSVTLTGATPISRTNGTLTTNNTTDLTFNASSNFTIPNGTFTNNPTILRNLTVNVGSPNLLSLGDQDINIENGGTITMTSGDLNIKGRVIKLCNTCSISEDITNSHIIRDATATTDTGTQGGYIETTRTVTTSSSGMAGLGVFLRRSSGSDYTVTIRRYHYTAGNGQGIRLVYKMSGSISGTNTNIGLRRPTSEENPNNYTTAQLVQIYRWSSGSWSDISSTDTGCFGGDVCTSSGQNSFSDWSLGSSQHPLPITLLRFQGKALNSRQAQLTWQTAFEKDNQGFEIEKSLDGANFTNIAFVQGVGNSNRLRNYQYLDNEFNQSAYYRLKQIDRDGIHYSYSETMFIRHQAEIGKAQIYPNPVANELKIFGLDQEKATNFTLFNAQGQMLCQVNDTPQEATKVLNTQLEKLPQGIYFLQIWQNGNLQTEKLIKY